MNFWKKGFLNHQKCVPYLGHIADDNSHDDSIDCNSFTEDNARGRNRISKGHRLCKTLLWTCSNKLMLLVLDGTIIHWMPFLAVDGNKTDKCSLWRGLPDQIFGFDSWSLDATTNNARASDVDPPRKTSGKKNNITYKNILMLQKSQQLV